ncbi:hypothetical protein AAMO2058_001576200 [Amorphochlora amoebiformis]|uniref:Receptor expression-enhancing protein n=1 Tax=Amorphochlora amoebiformis TaxID=1561963 RepID=A0A7S0H9N1_9EUKA|mmetsp:Transcript_8484/g.13304  ORF Transcript_8484/g.13304 Transcript_8484/m.13304 type:complete len:225 (+) Transcript_8484:44-718(+)
MASGQAAEEDKGWFEGIYEFTGVQSFYVILGLSIVSGSTLIRTFGFGSFGHFATFLYLVYMTFKVLQERHGRSNDKIYWLMYWAFYGIYTLFDVITELLFYWIPYLEVYKLIFLAWCLLPQTRGAQQVYYLIIHTILSQNEEEIDGAIAAVRDSISQVMTEIGQLGLEFIMEFMASMGVNIFQVFSQFLLAAASRPKERRRRIHEIKEEDEFEEASNSEFASAS